jgi:hypothetical protein
MQRLFPIAEVAGGGQGGGARPFGDGGACFVLAWGGRRQVGSGGPKGCVGRLATGPMGSEAENPFSIKIGFLNLLRLWKFVQGDLGGILTQGLFLNSSRVLKDFRKYNMPCHECNLRPN